MLPLLGLVLQNCRILSVASIVDEAEMRWQMSCVRVDSFAALGCSSPGDKARHVLEDQERRSCSRSIDVESSRTKWVCLRRWCPAQRLAQSSCEVRCFRCPRIKGQMRLYGRSFGRDEGKSRSAYSDENISLL